MRAFAASFNVGMNSLDDAVMVAVFDAKLGELQKRMKKHNAPFVVVADETYEQFRKNGVKKSFFKFLWGAMRSPLTLLQATLRGYVPLTMSISGFQPSLLMSSLTKRAMSLKRIIARTQQIIFLLRK